MRPRRVAGGLAVAAGVLLASTAAAGQVPANPARDSQAVSAAEPSSAGVRGPDEAVTPAGVSEDVRAACEMIARRASGCPGVTLQASEGSFSDDVAKQERFGCRLVIQGSFSALRGAADAAEVLHGELSREGWKEDLRYSADGPDGTRYRMSKGSILCIVEGRWDGGDDEDPSYVSSDRYDVTINCSRVAD